MGLKACPRLVSTRTYIIFCLQLNRIVSNLTNSEENNMTKFQPQPNFNQLWNGIWFKVYPIPGAISFFCFYKLTWYRSSIVFKCCIWVWNMRASCAKRKQSTILWCLNSDLGQIDEIGVLLTQRKRFSMWHTLFKHGMNASVLGCTDTRICPQSASQYHAWLPAACAITMLGV